MEGRENTDVNLYPEHAEHLAEGQWVVLKVEAWLDQACEGGWREALQGASIQLGPSPQVRLKADVRGKSLGVSVDEQQECLRFFPLMPNKGGTNRLMVAGRPRCVLTIGEDGLGLPVGDSVGEVLRLRPLPKSVSGCMSPLVFYKLQPIYPRFAGVLNTWKFKCYDTERAKIGNLVKRQLEGRITDSSIRLVGRQHHRRKASSQDPLTEVSHIYLVGVQPKGSRTVHLVEADLFCVGKDPHWGHEWAVREDLDSTEIADFREDRRAAVHGFGTHKKAMILDKAYLKTLDPDKVAGKEKGLEELADRRRRQPDTSLHLEELNNRRKMLPPFDITASDAGGIYATTLIQHLAPQELVAEEDVLLDEELVALLKTKPSKIAAMPESGLLRICKSQTVLSIVLNRAEFGLREGDSDAHQTCQKLNVLNVLVRMHATAKKKQQQLHISALAEECGMEKTSKFLKHVLTLFTSSSVARQSSVDMYKLGCHIIVWALHLTPDFSLDFRRIYKELGFEHEYAKVMLSYCGCKVKAEMSGVAAEVQGVESCVATLTAPLNLDFHQGIAKKRKKD